MEHQDRTDFRLPIYRDAPIRHKLIICEPLLSDIDFYNCLDTWVEQVIVGGESGNRARICNYDWVLDIRQQCIEKNINFWFKQTGAYLLRTFIERRIFVSYQASVSTLPGSKGENRYRIVCRILFFGNKTIFIYIPICTYGYAVCFHIHRVRLYRGIRSSALI